MPPALSPFTSRRVAATAAALALAALLASRRRLLRSLLRALLRLLRLVREGARSSLQLLSRDRRTPPQPSAEWADPALPVLLCSGTFADVRASLGDTQLWAAWMDRLGLDSASPSRSHVRQLACSEALQRRLDEVFTTLDANKSGRLGAAELRAFSAGLHGTLRTLLEHDARPLLPASAEEHEFLERSLDALFPPHAPLDRAAFAELAKLFLVRRVVRTLLAAHGLHAVRAGMRQPLVIDISVTPPGQRAAELRLVHTVTPVTHAAGDTGAKLGAIVEAAGSGADMDARTENDDAW